MGCPGGCGGGNKTKVSASNVKKLGMQTAKPKPQSYTIVTGGKKYTVKPKGT